MFYYLSKIGWFLIHPMTVLGILVLASALVSWTRRRRLARFLTSLSGIYVAFFLVVPIGAYGLISLENRFPAQPELPDAIDGIIVLGGAVDPEMTQARNQLAVGGSFDRVVAFAELAGRYPHARLVYTGGSHLFAGGIGEAEVVGPVLRQLGIDAERVIFESTSRNTYQNAVNTLAATRPGAGQAWVLITSASHMPRAVGAFRQAGWPDGLIAYPVDHRYRPDAPPQWFSMDLWGGIGSAGGAFREFVGLSFYYLTGRTDSWFPGPDRRE